MGPNGRGGPLGLAIAFLYDIVQETHTQGDRRKD